MNATGQPSIIQRAIRAIFRRLLRHVTWFASQSLNLTGQPGDELPLVVILGREHYSERRKTYPALRARDLRKVLDEELAGQAPTITLMGAAHDDSRDVRFFRLDPAVVDSLPRSLFIVPESLALGAQLGAGSWADVERQDYRYYLFPDGVSQPAGGALGQRNLVAIAAGVDPDQSPDEYHGSDELTVRLRRAITSIPVSTWWSCRNPVPRDWGFERVAWKPLAITAGAMLFAYLALSSIYLHTLLSYREGALEVLEPEIRDGLAADNDSRAYESRRDALVELWSGRTETQLLWGGVALALKNNATVSRIAMSDRQVRLSGEAPDASEILAVLASEPAFTDVSFDAPVRSVRNGRQNFSLSFALSGVEVAPVNRTVAGDE